MAPPLLDPFGLEGSVLDGRYEVHRVVARGGFGVVYQGRDVGLDDALAIKVLCLPPSLLDEERAILFDIFRQEARTTAQLKHPAIVRATGFGVSRMPNGQELPWMAMEWIDGRTLADVLRERDRPMAPAEALALLRPIIDALAFAHDREPPIAHRDVKPANILIEATSGRSARGVVGARLVDFGIAKTLEPDERATSGNTRTQGIFAAFSLPYAAPEQKAGMKTGPWTDVHAIGLILTEMLTGSTPYPGEDRLEVELRIVAPERPTPARFGIDVGAWEPVLAKAVARRPAERYQSAGELLDALEQALPMACHLPRNVPGATEPAWGQSSRPSTPTHAPSNPPLAPDTLSAATGKPPQTTAPANRKTWALGFGAVVVVALAVIAGQVLRSMRTASAPTAAVAAPPRPTRPVVTPPSPAPVAAPTPPGPATTAATPPPEVAAPARAAAPLPEPRVQRPRPRRNVGRRPTQASDGFEGM